MVFFRNIVAAGVVGFAVLGGHSVSNAQPPVPINETINKNLDHLKIVVNARGEGSLDHLIKSGTLGNKYQMKTQALFMDIETLVRTFGTDRKKDLSKLKSIQRVAGEIVDAKMKENPRLDGPGRLVLSVKGFAKKLETELTLPKE